MTLVGLPDAWLDLIDTLVPDILDLIVSTWRDMPAPASGAREDPTTEELCRRLRRNRGATELPFRIDIQLVELDPEADVAQGRMDIVFSPLIPTEDVYFCLECKRLNVAGSNRVRSYASEYVTHGMLRFVKGNYAARVHHGGMLAYVLDGNIRSAMARVSQLIRRRYQELGMQPPGTMLRSSIRPRDGAVRETRHARDFSNSAFCIHHIFAPCTTTQLCLHDERGD